MHDVPCKPNTIRRVSRVGPLIRKRHKRSDWLRAALLVYDSGLRLQADTVGARLLRPQRGTRGGIGSQEAGFDTLATHCSPVAFSCSWMVDPCEPLPRNLITEYF